MYAIKLTAVGAAKLAAANAGGPTVNLTQIAIGDGGGNPISTTPWPTALVREVARKPMISLAVSADDPTILVAEMVIPSNEGGYAIHEIAVLDSTGAVFAIGNFPATYKPTAAEGSTRDMDIKVAIKTGSDPNIQLVIDTSIIGATRQWVLATITRAYLIPGGTVGQVLAKHSNADGDTEWKSITDAINIAVDTIKETQTAAAGQTIFTLTNCTTDGIAVYIEGSREFDFTVLNTTQLQLAGSVTAGTRVFFVQNEPNEPLKLRRLMAGRAYFMGQF